MSDTEPSPTATPPASTRRVHKAGAFDIRTFIGTLIGIYGLVLVIAGIFDSSAEIKKADGVHINLYAGIGMLIGSAVFITWARLRPVVVPDEADADDPASGSGR